MKLALAYNTKNALDSVKQTWPRVRDSGCAVFWSDGSTDQDALDYFASERGNATGFYENVKGGADYAIVHGLTRLLQHPMNYTHIGMVESDVLLEDDWLRPTIELFDRGRSEGLEVGAVTPRTYVDRILFQRDGYAVLHNCGAGVIIMTRTACEHILRTFRTHYWPLTRYAFANMSGVDIGTYAAFGTNHQWTTSDWGWEFQLLAKGMCTLGLTPSKVDMINQNPPLAQQGLEIVYGPVSQFIKNKNFDIFVRMTRLVRSGAVDISGIVSPLHRQMGQTLFFPHQVGYLFPQMQGWRSEWCQGWGGFKYIAGPGGASLTIRCSSSTSSLVSGGADQPANCHVVDAHSGFEATPTLPAFTGEFIEVTAPGGSLPRTLALGLSEGGIFYGISCADPQLLNANYSFNWNDLPEPL